MKRYVGIDVAQKESALCIVDDAGSILFEGACATDPDEILQMIGTVTDDVEKIVHESGPLSIWLTRELLKRGTPVVCIDARAAHKVLSARMNKSDKSDAAGLAQLARTGWYGTVHVKSEASDQLRLLLAARERLIRIRMDIEGQARGLLKAYGIRLGPVNAGHAPSDLAALPFIANAALQRATNWNFTKGDRVEEISVTPALRLNTTPAINNTIAASRYVSILPDFLAFEDVAAGRLVRLLSDWSLRRGGIYALTPPTKYKPLAIQRFIHLVSAYHKAGFGQSSA